TQYQHDLTLTEHDLLHKEYLAAGREFDDSEADVALLMLRRRMAKEYEESRQLRHNAQLGKNTNSKDSGMDNPSNTAVLDERPVGDSEIPIFKVDRL
ncbi:hypothetical protein, partial [Pseudomonas umsongensis]|uniref:hypothetical protein n=1 Tax=Pseudomonas umsongensis TaxID=198618 RepID=UPI00200A57D1